MPASSECIHYIDKSDILQSNRLEVMKDTGGKLMATDRKILMKMSELLLTEQLISPEEMLQLTTMIQKGQYKDD